VCERLKVICHKDDPWVACYKEIAKKLTVLKNSAKTYYPDLDNEGILKELMRWPDGDILELAVKNGL
jgi:hypothetical protein